MPRLISAKHLLKAFLCLVFSASAALTARVAKADLVQIGTVTVTSDEDLSDPNAVPGQYYNGVATVEDDMSDTALLVDDYIELNTDGDPLDYLASLNGGGLSWRGANPDGTFTLVGTISSLDFTLNGQAYQADSLDWTSLSWAAGLPDDTLGIVIDATPISTSDPSVAPEPSSLLLLGTGIFGVAALSRLSRLLLRVPPNHTTLCLTLDCAPDTKEVRLPPFSHKTHDPRRNS